MAHALDRAISLVTDGAAADWESLLEEAIDARERALIEELRGLAQFDAHEPGPPPLQETLGVQPPGPHRIQRRWGHLELLEEIGHGASGSVFRAWDTRLAREVALKLIADDGIGGTIEEARRLARMSHPHVVGIYGADRIGHEVGLWMELLRGSTLEQIIRDQGPFSPREATVLALDICGAVAAVHRAGLIHRDIKAQNVMREAGGRLVLMDLGVSVDVTHGDEAVRTLAGTPFYMAPELFDGGKASVRSDVYAMGVLIYRLVTAEFPVHAETIGDVRRAHATAALRPLRSVRADLPTPFVDIVERCLAHDPNKRYGSVSVLEAALRSIDSGTTRTGGYAKWPIVTAGVALAVAAFAWSSLRFKTGPADNQSARPASISADQYKVFAGYEELAFDKRLNDPEGAAAALDGAWELIRDALPGNQPIFGLLRLQSSESLRHAGKLAEAQAATSDAGANLLLSVGEEHPYTAVLAMELARNAQAAGDHRTAAAQVLRALDIRSRVLGLAEFGVRHDLDAQTMERASRAASCERDSDFNGLLDCVDVAAGLDPLAKGSLGTDVLHDAEGHRGMPVSTRLALGLAASPLLTWAHYGAHEPRYVGWQSPPRFPMVERGQDNPGRWSMEAVHGQGYFNQWLSRAQSTRAMKFGFSFLARAQPAEGVTGLAVDLGPIGPRFDLTERRLDSRSIELRLLSSLIPLAGPTLTVEAGMLGPGPLMEMRYLPQERSVTLYVNGRRLSSGYAGHHQFQDSAVGTVNFGVMTNGGVAKAATSVNLVWLEIF